jgi:hypothetical protein
MAPLVTHLVIGERVFAQTQYLDPAPSIYGTFLLGCVLVDANGFTEIDRRQTHFAGRLEDDGENAFKSSCASFLSQRNVILRSPWDELTQADQAFVMGYLCHLAADEVWKEMGWKMLQALGIKSFAESPIAGEVFLTVYDILSCQTFANWPAATYALNRTLVPNVFTHVPYEAFEKMWEIARPQILAGGTAESYFNMLERLGTSQAEIQKTRLQHELYWDDASSFVHNAGGVEPYLQAAVERAVNMLPQLWTM